MVTKILPARLIIKGCAGAGALGFFTGAGIGVVYSKARDMIKSKSDDSIAEQKRVNKLK